MLRQEATRPDKLVMAKWDHEKDVYDCVVVAAFGGLHVHSRPCEDFDEEMSSDSSSSRAVRVHPIFPTMVCCVLFQLQMTYLCSIQFDIPPMLDASRPGSAFVTRRWSEVEDDAYSQLLLAVKGAMAFTLQMLSLSEFLLALRPWLMVMNPITWRSQKRFTTRSESCVMRISAHVSVLWMCCVCAKTMQLFVAFLACFMSLNVILAAKEISYALFNGLVLLFVSKLDEHAFSFVAALFNFDLRAYEDFEMELRDDEDDVRLPCTAEHPIACSMFCPWHIPPEAKTRLKSWHLALWKFGRRNRDAIIFWLLSAFYMWQLFIFLFTLDTGVLPRVRDVCALLRGRKHGGRFSASGPSLGNPSVSWVIDMATVFIDLDNQLERLRLEPVLNEDGDVEFATLDEACFHPSPSSGYARMTLSDVFVTSQKFPRVVLAIAVLLLTIFVLRNVAAILSASETPKRRSKGGHESYCGSSEGLTPSRECLSPTPETPLMANCETMDTRCETLNLSMLRAKLQPPDEQVVELNTLKPALELQLQELKKRVLDLEQMLQTAN